MWSAAHWKTATRPAGIGARLAVDMMPNRVLIVDPHAAFRSASKALLQTEGLEIVAALETYEGVVELTIDLRPDVALIDVSLHRPEGLELARRLASLSEPPAIVLMSAASPETILAASVGARAFVPKANLTADVIAHVAGASREREEVRCS
jgi:DNA-binding NarL/FixJ family response regulator